jgi:hypothetical protein
MIKAIRNNKIIPFFWCLLGIYFLNISVDATDNLYFDKPEDLTVNNQESIIEIVVEKVLGYENAISEQDDNDNSQNSIFKKLKSIEYTFHLEETTLFINPALSYKKTPFNYYFKNILNPFLEINSPPPKA